MPPPPAPPAPSSAPATLTFDLASRGEATGPALNLGESLRFSPPKDADDRGDSKVCTARAYLVNPGVKGGKTSLRLSLHGADLVRLSHSRQDAHTLVFSQPVVDGGSALVRFMFALDARVLDVARTSTDAWFLHKMNADLVEEYYRGSVSAAVDRHLVRFVVDSSSIPPALAPGTRVDATLQLVGLQFRPQYFTCTWKVLSATPEIQDPDPPQQQPNAAAAAVAPLAAVPRFVEEETKVEDVDDDDDGYVGPDAEQRVELRRELMDRLMRLERDEQDRIDALRDMIRVLDTAEPGKDLDVIADMYERLETGL
jgi:hypothetical protein